MFYWHHITGLVFGVVTLAFVASGLVSMHPWGFSIAAASRANVVGLRVQHRAGRRYGPQHAESNVR
jgi:hypothetical protein